MAASHGDSHAVLVVLKNVVGHVGVERLHHGQSSVAIVVDVVTCRVSDVCLDGAGKSTRQSDFILGPPRQVIEGVRGFRRNLSRANQGLSGAWLVIHT